MIDLDDLTAVATGIAGDVRHTPTLPATKLLDEIALGGDLQKFKFQGEMDGRHYSCRHGGGGLVSGVARLSGDLLRTCA